jgi:hypothetical protein
MESWDRWRRRPTVRLGTSLGAAGALVAVVGSWLVAGDSFGSTGFGEEPSTALGTITGLALVATGWGAISMRRTGAVAAAGAVALVLGWPTFTFFVTYDSLSGPSIDAMLLVPALALTLAYLVGTGRGHPSTLGVALVLGWLFVVDKVGSLSNMGSAFFVVDPFASDPFAPDPFASDPFASDPFASDPFGPSSFSAPDPTTIGLVSLLIGLGYLAAATLFDRQDRRGLATPFVPASILATVVGVLALGQDLGDVGLAMALIALGAGYQWFGSRRDRRASAWVGIAVLVWGVGLLIGELVEGARAGGVLAFLVGLGLVAAAHAVEQQQDEPSELVEDRPPGVLAAATPVAVPGTLAATAGTEAVGTSDTGPRGPGWWLASDGNWYPPQ